MRGIVGQMQLGLDVLSAGFQQVERDQRLRLVHISEVCDYLDYLVLVYVERELLVLVVLLVLHNAGDSDALGGEVDLSAKKSYYTHDYCGGG